jgi:type II secretory pathway pseudopilin PulG
MDTNHGSPINDPRSQKLGSPSRRFVLSPFRHCDGFTLAELLIATGVTAGIVLMLGWMLGSLMASASHTTQRVDAFRDARAALQLIERDLRNLVRNQWNPDPFTNQTLAPCTASTVSTTAVTLPTAYFALDNRYADDPAAGNPNQQLYALVADTTNPSSGDVCAVGYYCRWDVQLHAYSLRRYFRRFSLTEMHSWGTDYAGDSVLYSATDGDAVLAAYVWNLKITPYDAAGSPNTTYPCVCDALVGGLPKPIALPAAIEISFNAMSPQAARTVMSVTAGMTDSAAAAYWMNMDPNLVKPHAYEFRSRINLP